jgi:hypothetical protein
MSKVLKCTLFLGVVGAYLTNAPLFGTAVNMAQGIAGNLLTDFFSNLDKKSGSRYLSGWRAIDENHTILKNLRTSQLKTLRHILENYNTAQMAAPDEGKNEVFSLLLLNFISKEAGATFSDVSREESYRTAVLRVLPDSLQTTLAARQVDKTHSIQNHETVLRRAVEEGILSEIKFRTIGIEEELPHLFLSAFYGGQDTPGWYDLFIRDVSNQLKENQELANIWNAEHVAFVSEIVRTIDAKLDQALAKLEDMQVQQAQSDTLAKAQFAALHQKVDLAMAELKATGGLIHAAKNNIFESSVRQFVTNLVNTDKYIELEALLPTLKEWIAALQMKAPKSADGQDLAPLWRLATQHMKRGELSLASQPFVDELRREEDEETKRQQNRKSRKLELLKAATKFYELAQNIESAFDYIIEAVNLEFPDSSAGRFNKLFEIANEYLSKGEKSIARINLFLAFRVLKYLIESDDFIQSPDLQSKAFTRMVDVTCQLGDRTRERTYYDCAVAAAVMAIRHHARPRSSRDVPMLYRDLVAMKLRRVGRLSDQMKEEEANRLRLTAFRMLARVDKQWFGGGKDYWFNHRGVSLQGLDLPGEHKEPVANNEDRELRELEARIERARQEHAQFGSKGTSRSALRLADDLVELGSKTKNLALFQEAIGILDSAVVHFRRTGHGVALGEAQKGLADAYVGYYDLTGDRHDIERAIRYHRSTVSLYNSVDVPLYWARSLVALSNALMKFAERGEGGNRKALREIVDNCALIMREMRSNSAYDNFAYVTQLKAKAHILIWERYQKREDLHGAIETYKYLFQNHTINPPTRVGLNCNLAQICSKNGLELNDANILKAGAEAYEYVIANFADLQSIQGTGDLNEMRTLFLQNLEDTLSALTTITGDDDLILKSEALRGNFNPVLSTGGM